MFRSFRHVARQSLRTRVRGHHHQRVPRGPPGVATGVAAGAAAAAATVAAVAVTSALLSPALGGETSAEGAEPDLAACLYPPVEPYKTGRLRVSDVHELYYEESGNPNGKPVVFVHGGPGGGSSAAYRTFFNPDKYRIILFDQRGCGKSTPHACLEENTTWHLISDMEALRKECGVDTWQVFGGSWGSTLGLSYAIMHPDRVDQLVLRGIFMLRRQELEWYYQKGASFIFPDQWEGYRDAIPPLERGDLMEAFRKRLNGTVVGGGRWAATRRASGGIRCCRPRSDVYVVVGAC